MKQLGSNHPDSAPIKLLHSIPTKDTVEAEKGFHECFASKRIKGEWFKLTEEDINSIRTITEL